jgi:RimJ/RimL family protein N-acetyltransferase
MKIVPFLPQHIVGLEVHEYQKRGLPKLDMDYGIYLYQGGPAFSCEVSGKIIGCGGLLRWWPGRASGWTLLSKETGQYMPRITRVVIRFLEIAEESRIEITVDDGFEAGYRWAELLGFKRECLMRKYLSDGRDVWLYSRIK